MQATSEEYYRHLYPYEKLAELMTSNGDELYKIEFAIEGEVYKRFVSARNAEELKKIVSNFPGVTTLHFGAIYSNKPSSSERMSVPVRRVLSFDIDLTDKGFLPLKDATGAVSAELCDKAWPVCAASVDILKRILKVAFGYTNIVVVYSGRRGVHVHVFDEAAMSLSSDARAAIVSYINGNAGKDGESRSTSGVRLVMQMHNLRQLTYVWFEEFVRSMDLFESCSARADFVKKLELEKYDYLSDAVGTLAEEAMDMEDGMEAWRHIVEKVNGIKDRAPWALERLDCTVLAYVWPILDANVSKDLAHLTKVPFACHAKTGRVACTIDPEDFWNFAPGKDAPSLHDWDQDKMNRVVQHMHAHLYYEGVETMELESKMIEDEARERRLEEEAREALCDMEDLAGVMDRAEAPRRPKARPAPSSPRKLTWKRKKSPLVPTEN